MRAPLRGLGTDDPRADLLVALLDVRLDLATGSRDSLTEAVSRCIRCGRCAVGSGLTSLDELTLLAHLALAEFDEARAI